MRMSENGKNYASSMTNAIESFILPPAVPCSEKHTLKFISQYELQSLMGQLEVSEFLRNNPNRWFSSREISNGTAMSFPTSIMALKRMRDNAEVDFEGSGRMGDRYRYKFKD